MAQFEHNGILYEEMPGGQARVIGPASSASQGPQPFQLSGPDRFKVNNDNRANAAADRAAAAAEAAARNTGVSNTLSIAEKYNSDPTVKSYRTALGSFAQALNTGTGPQADLALTYAFAKAMDPDSVVRESEQGMVTSSQPWFQAAVEKAKKQFGMDGAGNFTPEARDALRAQIANSVNQRQRVYDARRTYFEKQAQAFGVDPQIIVGEHDKTPFLNDIDTFNARVNAAKNQPAQTTGPAAKPLDVAGMAGNVTDDGGTYQDSYLGQGMSGVNEGIANTLGAPVDLTTAAINLVPQGINAIANTNLPQITNPIGGSQWFKNNPLSPTIFDPTNDPSKNFTRRVGQSVGSAFPVAGGAGTLARGGASLLSAAGGGLGAASAQQAFPGNPLAEMAGEVIGGGATGGGILALGRRGAQRDLEAQIPTVDMLKQQAGNLYRQAETRGVAATPQQTQTLRGILEQTLRDEGQFGPKGRVTDADTNTTKAFNLVDQYAGTPMKPVEMNTVRGVIAEGRGSADPSDRRLAGILTSQFDDWARPMAPEFDQARDVSSRYLQAQDLEQARELARANSSQFGASGPENALRTQYRGLDKADINGRSNFAPEVSEAIQNVSRGTPMSNLARNIGRFAPTGPVSFGASVLGPVAAGGAVGGPVGGMLGATLAPIAASGRAVANSMTNRAADVAELTARNGGALPQAPLVTPDIQKLIAMLAASQTTNYLPRSGTTDFGIMGRSGSKQ